MTLKNEIAAFLCFYPQIYFACHRRHVRDEKARKAISLNQASILDHLDGIEPTNLHELARHMGVTPSTMSLNVDRLEKAGYVRRERDREDARRIELRLTDKGERLKQQQTPFDPQLIEALLKRMKSRDRMDALRGLELLAKAAGEMSGEKWDTKQPGLLSGRGKTKRSSL